MAETKQWILVFQIHGQEKIRTGSKAELMEMGRALLEDNFTHSAILTDGKVNAKCWWHAGRVEWSDFVPIGEFFTSSAKKKQKTAGKRRK